MDIGLAKDELHVFVNYGMSYSEFSEYIKTEPALLKAAQGTEKYYFKIEMK
jgi:hypothetical protein